ncbi:hypothetical protein WS76_13835 [Burkholderia humptydooensis]|nr:hypothetical protein WS76_13835 [Burkholderia humptydooensis]
MVVAQAAAAIVRHADERYRRRNGGDTRARTYDRADPHHAQNAAVRDAAAFASLRDDRLPPRVNAHTREDDRHWPWWLLKDLERLGWSRETTMTDALRALWNDDTHRCRLPMYELCAIVEAIEETGNVLLALTTRLADEVQAQTGRELRYVGAYHFAREHAQLSGIELDAAKRRRCVAPVDRVFDAFAAWTHEAAGEIARVGAPSVSVETP